MDSGTEVTTLSLDSEENYFRNATLVDADSSQPSKTSDAALSNSRSRSRSPEKQWKPEIPKRSLSVEY